MISSALLLTLLGCSSNTTTLTVAGSSTIRPLAEVAAETFEVLHPDIRVNIQGGGSGVGVSSARSGLADIGMVSRALKDSEHDLHPIRIARDGIAVIVHSKRSEVQFTSEQIVAMYSGKTSTWPDGSPLTLVNKEEGRSTRELFEHHFHLSGKFRDDLVVIGPNGQAISTVASDPNALAYVSIGSASQAEAAGIKVRRVPIDGIEATVAAVTNNTWPLARELNLVTKEPPTGAAKTFIDFILSAEGQTIVAAEDFVPLAP